MKYDIVGSIVAYKSNHDMLKKTVDSFCSTNLKTKLFIIDNSPTNEIEQFCDKNQSNKIEYTFNNANIGYGAAHNIAINKSIDDSKYYLVLNPDVFFENGTLEKIYEFMNTNENVGLVMPKILYPDSSIQYLCKLLPTPFDLIFRRFFPIKKLLDKRNETSELRFTEYDKIMSVPCLSGCFMFLRNEALKKIGMFDERYFMYLEDVDLSRRIHRYYETIFYPASLIYHGYKKESYHNKKVLYYHISSAIKYFNKWGWFYDKDRRITNKKILKNLTSKLK